MPEITKVSLTCENIDVENEIVIPMWVDFIILIYDDRRKKIVSLETGEEVLSLSYALA